jgi:hypothetical protein
MRDFRDSSKQANESDTRRVEGSAEFSGNALEHLLDLMVGPGASVMRALAGMGDGAKARASPAAPAGEGGSEPQASGEIGAYLTQTYLMMATRGVHYWWRLAQIHARHQSEILASLTTNAAAQGSGTSEQQRRMLTDTIRAYLREIGDVSVQEARILEAELDRLAAALAESTRGPAPAMKKWRRWKAIP